VFLLRMVEITILAHYEAVFETGLGPSTSFCVGTAAVVIIKVNR
jgi:hypothetical protein